MHLCVLRGGRLHLRIAPMPQPPQPVSFELDRAPATPGGTRTKQCPQPRVYTTWSSALTTSANHIQHPAGSGAAKWGYPSHALNTRALSSPMPCACGRMLLLMRTTARRRLTQVPNAADPDLRGLLFNALLRQLLSSLLAAPVRPSTPPRTIRYRPLVCA